MQHVITQETENENLLDIGQLEIQRKLYYRELIARFGHHPGLVWNMGEENGYAEWTPVAQTNDQRKEMITYFDSIEPYGNLIAIHTLPTIWDHKQTVTPLLGVKGLDAISFQIADAGSTDQVVKKWLKESTKAGNPWITWLDEIGPVDIGAWGDERPQQQDTVRKVMIWANLMNGGAGIEHYFGYKQEYSDLTSEDWHDKDRLWDMTCVATSFFSRLPVQKMSEQNSLVIGENTSCFAQTGEKYVVYMHNPTSVELDLSGQQGMFNIQWYDPIRGGKMLKGSQRSIKGGKKVSLGNPPKSYSDQDWAILVSKRL